MRFVGGPPRFRSALSFPRSVTLTQLRFHFAHCGQPAGGLSPPRRARRRAHLTNAPAGAVVVDAGRVRGLPLFQAIRSALIFSISAWRRSSATRPVPASTAGPLKERGEAPMLIQHRGDRGSRTRTATVACACLATPAPHRFLAVAVFQHVPGAHQHLVGGRQGARRRRHAPFGHDLELVRLVAGQVQCERIVDLEVGVRQDLVERFQALLQARQLIRSMAAERAAKAAVSEMLRARSEVSWRSR